MQSKLLEMNMHCAQSIVTETEIRHLAATPYQIINPGSNKPIIGIFQDSLLGSFRFTRKDIKFSPRDAMNLLMSYPHVDVNAIRKAGKEVTNFDILSQITPPITLKYKTGLFDEDTDDAKDPENNNMLEIYAGKYIRGQVEKSVFEAATKGILHRICNDFGNMACADYNDNLQNIVTEYMKTSSFSVGISDLIADRATNEKIVEAIRLQKMEVQTIIDKVHLGIFENNTAASNMKHFELMLSNILNKATEESGKIGKKSLSKDNRFLMIVNSGSKGNLVNISQMISCLGQQAVDGKRIAYGFDDRTLPHYKKYDDSPNSRGFVENSYITGLTAPELFFHAMAGRTGLIDTAVKSVTSDTPIVIIENGRPLYTEIGKWIDNQLDDPTTKDQIEHSPNDRNLELLNIQEGNVYIPTTDEHGVVTWGDVTAITRHDPGHRLYEVVTLGGRKVTVAESQSLLVWDHLQNKFLPKPSPEIQVGEYMPVTAVLAKSPIELNSVDLTHYLPKTHYVYGTDFHDALNMINDAMNDRCQIPREWWSQHNGNEFTLPYTKKASIQRTSVRSDIQSIQRGYIYPYHAKRNNTLFKDKFMLNEENGKFIGLFLAEGCVNRDTIVITNNHLPIQSFVKQWFEKHGITPTTRERINNIGGKTTTTIGSCVVFARFLTQWVGHGAKNKHVPDDAFIAPNEFIVGLLNGYFSGDGTVSKNSIEVGSASKRLIEGISMLCSRFGIFGKMFQTQLKSNNLGTQNILPSYRFSIRAQWGQIFANNIQLIEENKQKKILSIVWGTTHRNFKTIKDVVLDPIVNINIIGVENNPKLYDLTIPSTLNFGLANGLQVRDTSSTGYIQRRLVKGLEDLMINYDMTVRNNKGKIIQFTYGDDNFDSMKVENQILPMANLSVEDIYMHFDIPGMMEAENNLRLAIFTKEAISRMNKQKEKCRDKCYEYATRLVRDRDLIVEKVFLRQSENSVRLPVAFQYLIQNVQGQLDLKGNSAVDITPFEAFELIEEYFERVNSIPFAKTNPLFRVLYFYYLTPRDLLVKRRFHKKALILLLENVLLKFKEALVHPGEMVGVVAATSTGEPCTQLTLNTFHGSGIASKSNVTRGVPRIEEILRLTKNPKNPSMTIYLKPMDETDQDKASQFATRISHTKLIDVVKSVQVCFDPNPTATHIVDDQLFLEQFFEFEKMIEDCMETNPTTNPPSRSKWIIRIEMDQESLIDKNINMDDIHFAISNSEYGKDVQCIFSDHNMDKLVFRIRTNGSVFDKSKKTRGVSNPLDQSDEIYMLKNFQDTLLNNIVLRGVNGVHNILPRKIQNSVVKESDKYVKKDTWVLDTTGSNLMETLALDYIDFRRTISNDIKEVFHVLGIEAARQCIQNELIEVLAFSGASVNYHHTSLLCDRMTCNKNMVSIFRSGLLNDNVGPIAKATFEVHTEVFLNAARHAELDHMRGVSANIMCGQHGSYGTNASQIILDMKAFENIKSNKYQRKDVSEEIERGMAQVNDTPVTCSKIEIQNNIVNIRHTNDNSTACYDDGYNAGF